MPIKTEAYLHLGPHDLLKNDIETKRKEVIPVENILTEESLIDHSHAKYLGESMKGKRHQTDNIVVRARILDGEIVYDVIDGFHRVEGKRITGEKDIKAKVLYGCSDEKMFDLRVLSASSVKSIQFARIAHWITETYELTPWASKGLSVTQAFTIAHIDSKNTGLGNNQISKEDVEELKKWARDKCETWKRPLGSVRIELQLVAISDPNLVNEVRPIAGGHEAEKTITQIKLATVVRAFPGEANFVIQRAILHFATENKVKLPEIETIMNSLKDKNLQRKTEEEIKILIKEIYDEMPKIGFKKKKPKKKPLEDNIKIIPIATFKDEEGPTSEEIFSLEQALEQGEDITNIFPKEKNKQEKFHISPDILQKLRQRVRELENQLEIALAVSTPNKPFVIDEWWKKADYLTPLEKGCLERVFYGDEDPAEVANSHKFTIEQVFNHIHYAFAKKDHNSN